jgi:hypothetical protein
MGALPRGEGCPLRYNRFAATFKTQPSACGD